MFSPVALAALRTAPGWCGGPWWRGRGRRSLHDRKGRKIQKHFQGHKRNRKLLIAKEKKLLIFFVEGNILIFDSTLDYSTNDSRQFRRNIQNLSAIAIPVLLLIFSALNKNRLCSMTCGIDKTKKIKITTKGIKYFKNKKVCTIFLWLSIKYSPL